MAYNPIAEFAMTGGQQNQSTDVSGLESKIDAQNSQIQALTQKLDEQSKRPAVSQFNPTTAQQTVNTAMGKDVVGMANQLIGDPAAFFSDDMKLSSNVPTIDANAEGTNINPADPRYAMDKSGLNIPVQTAQTSTAESVQNAPVKTYSAATTEGAVANAAMTGAQGTVSDEATVEAEQADMQGLSTGTNKDGSINYAGQALGQYASQNISTVIDTSTISGKLLAESLGEFNYTDSKATVQGQLDLLSKQFTDPVTGEPKIPTWAAGVARNVSRIAAFKGVTGTAATAAMAQAIMEASIPVAQADAQFFQTLTVQNLNNKQQQVINTANVLSKMELANLDYRMQAAVENSKNFMQMDLANLNNEQQARVINTQARVQSILEDAKSQNTARLFAAQSENEQNRFYDNLRTQISTFNTSQKNSMEQFNTGQRNSIAQFNAQLENQRETFYKEMQYNIDIANTKWRQTVTLQNNEMVFQAAATDVKNMVGLSIEQLNQLWDRSDALLDYVWKSSETQAERENNIAVAKLQADANIQMNKNTTSAQQKAASSSATGSIVGATIGAAATIGVAIF